MNDNAISVKQLNLYVKSLIESDSRLSYISVEGELSNFKNHYSSGHWYFTLKDNDASIRCVMFRSSAARVKFSPCDGMKVIISGRVSIYEKDGQYQFYAENMIPFGEGDLSLQFKITKEKLEKEGLFDEANKRPVKKMPERVAVITSDTGAALHDICSTFEKRLPSCEIIVCSATVQGVFAAKDMISILDRVYALSDIDTIIIGRGGGSAEDLSAFNDEQLARKVYESPVPIVSAVGHETDFTICDFVADLRAATPTAAAMLCSVDFQEYLQTVDVLETRLKQSLLSILEKYELKYKSVVSSRVLKNPCEIIDKKQKDIESCRKQLNNLLLFSFDKTTNRLKNDISLLDSLSPLKTLKRGFSVVSKDENTVSSVKNINIGDKISLRFSDGTAKCEVKEKTENG